MKRAVDWRCMSRMVEPVHAVMYYWNYFLESIFGTILFLVVAANCQVPRSESSALIGPYTTRGHWSVCSPSLSLIWDGVGFQFGSQLSRFYHPLNFGKPPTFVWTYSPYPQERSDIEFNRFSREIMIYFIIGSIAAESYQFWQRNVKVVYVYPVFSIIVGKLADKFTFPWVDDLPWLWLCMVSARFQYLSPRNR
jgi:hypothetical protein